MMDRVAERRLKPDYPLLHAHIKRRVATQHSYHPWNRGLKPTATLKGRSATAEYQPAPNTKRGIVLLFVDKAQGLAAGFLNGLHPNSNLLDLTKIRLFRPKLFLAKKPPFIEIAESYEKQSTRPPSIRLARPRRTWPDFDRHVHRLRAQIRLGWQIPCGPQGAADTEVAAAEA